MESSLVKKYFKSGDNVTLSLKNEEKFVGEIIEITDTHLGIARDYSISVIALEQIALINKDFEDNMQSKNNEILEQSTNPNFYQQELIMKSTEEHQRDTDIGNLAVEFHLLSDLEDLEEFYERNERLINSSEHLTKLYQEKLAEFS